MTKNRAFSTAAICFASAVAGSVLTLSATSAASPASTGAAVTAHYLHGGYLLSDGKCPRHTVRVNAQVRASTNSPSGHSTFALCFIK
jgi:hypothetical protein